MDTNKKIETYLAKQASWTNELTVLRTIFKSTELVEEVKWGTPTYTYNGSLVAGFAGFKNHYAIWFHQGVFLKDEEKQLVNAQEGKTKAMRQWRFEKETKVDPTLIRLYIEEAIANAKAGKKVKPQQNKTPEIPEIFQKELEKNAQLNSAFFNLTPGKQREYASHIGEAKREATQVKRMEKSIPLILSGKGLHDKYKNC